MKTYTCAIIEDSNIQRVLLEKAVKNHPSLELLFSTGNSLEGLQKTNDIDLDILFLDIEIPSLNGFDFLDRLKFKPQIILYSGHTKYALKGFEYGVTDFLLKPFNSSRFDIAVRRAISKQKKEDLKEREEALVVKSNLKRVEIPLTEIQWIEALGDYVKVITPKKNHVVLSSLTKFNERLPEDTFLRIHKSYVINLRLVEKYNHIHVEIAGQKLPISRSKNLELDKVLNFLE